MERLQDITRPSQNNPSHNKITRANSKLQTNKTPTRWERERQANKVGGCFSELLKAVGQKVRLCDSRTGSWSPKRLTRMLGEN